MLVRPSSQMQYLTQSKRSWDVSCAALKLLAQKHTVRCLPKGGGRNFFLFRQLHIRVPCGLWFPHCFSRNLDIRIGMLALTAGGGGLT